MAAKRISVAKLPLYWYIYLLILPSVLLVSVFAYSPAASGIYHSFFRWNGDFINEFVGFRNFLEAFNDKTLWYGFRVIGILLVADIFKMVPSIITAVVINRLTSEKSAYFYKVLFVVPMIIPWMVYLLIWKYFFDPTAGVLNAVLNATGLMKALVWFDALLGWGGVFVAGSNPVWLGHQSLIIPSLILWGFPWVGVVGVLIYLAGLQSIDKSVYEAADIDGIGPIKKFFHIELPLIASQVRINLVMMIIGALQGYGTIYILFGIEGGPGGVAMVPGLYMFANAFAYQKVGYACALGVLLFIFILILTEINNRFVRVDK